jgi:thymidine phosphorylase
MKVLYRTLGDATGTVDLLESANGLTLRNSISGSLKLAAMELTLIFGSAALPGSLLLTSLS